MRTNTVLQERHLIEAVRQQVITHDQMEGVLAIARSANRAEAVAAPDLRWIGYLQGAIVAIASLGVAAWNNDHIWSTPPAELFARALVATAAHKLRRHMLTLWVEDPSRVDEDRSIWA